MSHHPTFGLLQPSDIPVGSTIADRVYGQLGSFFSATANNGGITANSLNLSNYSIAANSSGIFISDFNNKRVLFYSGTSTTASAVYGQVDFISGGNVVPISASTTSSPTGLAYDESGILGDGLYVASNASRVLFFPGSSTTATRVYGQLGDFTTANYFLSPTADSIRRPRGVAVDPSSGVYIVDSIDHRVLFFPGTSTTPTRVYGQGGSFTSGVSNLGGVSANSLRDPYGICIDPSGGIYVADSGNHRVLHFSGTSTTADRVYGQGGNFLTAAPNSGGINANSLNNPIGVYADANGVYISNYSGNRVLFYPGTSTTATKVFGQWDDFTTGVSNKNGRSYRTLSGPTGVVTYGTDIYIGDTINCRVLHYNY